MRRFGAHVHKKEMGLEVALKASLHFQHHCCPMCSVWFLCFLLAGLGDEGEEGVSRRETCVRQQL
jgi:hypothetical protein